jgi:hypothetical protein
MCQQHDWCVLVPQAQRSNEFTNLTVMRWKVRDDDGDARRWAASQEPRMREIADGNHAKPASARETRDEFAQCGIVDHNEDDSGGLKCLRIPGMHVTQCLTS